MFFYTPSVSHSFLIENQTRGHVLTLHQSVLWRLIKNGLQPLLHYDHLQGLSVEKRHISTDNQQDWHLLESAFDNFRNDTQQHLPFYLEAIGVSESKLNPVCKKIANRTPKRLIHDRVILEVKRLLVFTNLSVNKICYQAGFNDPAYFSRFFKRLTDVTALAYRRDNT